MTEVDKEGMLVHVRMGLNSNVHSIPNPNSISEYFRHSKLHFHSIPNVLPNSFPSPNYRRNGLEFHFQTPNRQKFRCIWFGNGSGKIDNARCWQSSMHQTTQANR